MAPRSGQRTPPSRTAVLATLGVAIVAGIALVLAAALVRDGSDGDSVATPRIDFSGIPQAGTTLGDASAAVTLIEYADLQCPACRQYAIDVFPAIVAEYVRPGRVKAEYRGFPFLGEDSFKAERFVLAAGRQSRLWNLQEALYWNQGAENSGWVTDELIHDLAGEIPGLNVDRLFDDAGSAAITKAVDDGRAEGEAAGVTGTPTFFIQIGHDEPYALQPGLTADQLGAALDDALAG